MHVVFREFRASDWSELEQMVMGLYAEDPDGAPMTRDHLEATVQELTRHPSKGRLVMFTVDHAIVGYALVIFYWSNEYGGNIVHIDELYVKAPWRQRGIARQFLTDLRHADATTTKALQLEVTPTNKRAYAYYQKLGFMPSPNTHLVQRVAP